MDDDWEKYGICFGMFYLVLSGKPNQCFASEKLGFFFSD
jgi:hypothetical protein